jgi:putative methionine-R-sulfoxide reductase with GAF domain
VARGKKLQDHIEELFSDVSIPDPQAREEIPPATVQAEGPGAPEAFPTPDAPQPQETTATAQAEPAASADVQWAESRVQKAPQPERASPLTGPTALERVKPRWQSSLGFKLILGFLAAAIVPSLVIAAFAIVSQVSRIRSQTNNNLELLAALQEDQIDQWIQTQTSAIDLLAQEPDLEREVRSLLVTKPDIDEKGSLRLSIRSRFSSFQVQHPVFERVFLLNDQGQVIISTDESHQDQLENDRLYFIQGLQDSYYGPPTLGDQISTLHLVVAEPLRYFAGEPIGVLVGFVDSEPLTALIHSAPGLGKTGQAYLVNQDGMLITSLKDKEVPAPPDVVNSAGISRAIAGTSGRGTYSDLDGISVFGAYRWLPSLQMGLLVEREVAESYSSLFVVIGATLSVTALAIALTAVFTRQMTRRIAQPILDITTAAQMMMNGDLHQTVKVDRTDEIGVLSEAFNQMAERLRKTIDGLETTIQERTIQLQDASSRFQRRAFHLEAIMDVSQAATSILDPAELLQTTADLIQDRFGFYHVSFFLLDESGDWAVVRASTGEIGRQMVGEPHRLRVGGQSMVGWVCAESKPRVALDVGDDANHFDHPMLPHTRSELVLPLLASERLLGALDVQSTEAAAFDQDDVRTLQGMANLVAVALQNARLYTETRKTAQHQQLVSRVLERLQVANTVSDVLTITLEELGASFDLAEATIALDLERAEPTTGNGWLRPVVSHPEE